MYQQSQIRLWETVSIFLYFMLYYELYNTVPVLNCHIELLKVLGGFYMVRQTIPNFRYKDS